MHLLKIYWLEEILLFYQKSSTCFAVVIRHDLALVETQPRSVLVRTPVNEEMWPGKYFQGNNGFYRQLKPTLATYSSLIINCDGKLFPFTTRDTIQNLQGLVFHQGSCIVRLNIGTVKKQTHILIGVHIRFPY